MEQALHLLCREPVRLTGCGRTDTGVHARRFYAHFDKTLPITSAERFRYKLNAILPAEIAIDSIFSVSDRSHARFDAKEREYRYFIHTAKNPFLQDLSLFYPYPLDMEAMNRAAQLLTGSHDFTSFAKLHSDTANNRCTVNRAFWERTPHGLVFIMAANRFLRNMVRCSVGTLLQIGRGKQSAEWILQVLEQKNRCAADESVSSCGLFLWNVDYDFLTDK